jgi:integrase
MSLTETAIRNAKPNSKAYRIKDDFGLYLEIHPTGKKVWRMRYWIHQKEGNVKLGEYPLTNLKEARSKRDEVRKLVESGIKPVTLKGNTLQEENSSITTFASVSKEWFDLRRKEDRDAKTIDRTESRIRRFILPFIGHMEMDAINAPLLLNVFRRIESKGVYETAHRTLNTCGQIFRYAIVKGDTLRDPTSDLRGALLIPKENHYSTITNPKEIASLLSACEGYLGSDIVRIALSLLPLVFVRPGELRHMEWTEVDFDSRRWTIPDHKMKSRRIHIVPLSQQALDLLRELLKFSGRGRYAFPSVRTPAGDRPMSDNTINAALRRLGFGKDEIVAHGFRAMASTILYEHDWPGDVIELQLAHRERNKIKAAYNHAQHIDKRREMMQWWADYLDELKKAKELSR